MKVDFADMTLMEANSSTKYYKIKRSTPLTSESKSNSLKGIWMHRKQSNVTLFALFVFYVFYVNPIGFCLIFIQLAYN